MELPISVDLSGKTAVITGGGGVLCSGFAKTLAAAGARVAVLDINEAAANAVAQEIEAAGGAACGVRADCLDMDSLRAAAEQVEACFGPCDILINGAGGNHPGATTDAEVFDPADGKSFFALDPSAFARVFGLNVQAAVMTTQAFAKPMTRRGGTIINVSSMNAYRPLTKIPAYSAAKAAVSNFTQWLAVYLAPCGVRVNAIAPGFFLTNQNRGLLLREDGSYAPRAEKILAHTPQGRFGEPEDLAGTLLWLASEDASAFVTGVVVPVDGGFAAYSGV